MGVATIALGPALLAGAQAPPPVSLAVQAPAERAHGVAIPVRGRGAVAGEAVALERRHGDAWEPVAQASAGPDGRFTLRYRPRRAERYRLRVTAASGASQPFSVAVRDVVLAAVGDVNFGDGVAAVFAQRGVLWPWRGVGPVLRRADVAFGNLECSISRRGAPVPKEFNFRGDPSALRKVVRYAGLDALNLANNHLGDYGSAALLDTVRNVRRLGVRPVGAGATLGAALRPQLVTRLGLRIAFVGFSDIGPASFFAGPRAPGTAPATPGNVRAGVRAARRRADVVIASFHWGIERQTQETPRQRAFAHAAIAAGADAVIAAHPHVLQPIRRVGRHRLIAYSLGNFVWSAASPLTTRTGILRVRLSARGVEGSKLLPAVIFGSRPRLL
jgi:capsule synthesis protein PGA_cap